MKGNSRRILVFCCFCVDFNSVPPRRVRLVLVEGFTPPPPPRDLSRRWSWSPVWELQESFEFTAPGGL